jgi:Winged helix-turn helix/DDE superfamily endonuclease
MRSGFWPVVGLLPKWLKLWSGMPIRLAIGSKTFASRVRLAWRLSRPVVPPALDAAQQAALKAPVQATPRAAGIDLANWNWKVVRLFIQK